jgi:hypothetical protein
LHHGSDPGGQRNLVERSDINQAQSKSSLGHQANFQAPCGAYKKDVGSVMFNQLVRYRESWNNVAAGTAPGDKNSKFRQSLAFLEKNRLIK